MEIEHVLPADTASTTVAPIADWLEKIKTQTTQLWHRLTLLAIVVLTAFLGFYQVDLNGYGNTYYAAAVKSMLVNWHNFFFVSFDPGGFVTVDKPPLGLWIEALSARIFGFSGFSLLLPQTIATILSVLIIYHLVRRSFGPIAGLVAALVLAITPISSLMSRDNNQDMMMVFFLMLATWWVILATEQGKLRWLLLCALAVGLAFNIKALEAYLLVPAFGLLYLLGAPGGWWKRIGHLSLALLLMLLISLSWMAAVDLTPASQRPYVGSSQTNSEIELALGYNGLQRLTGMNNNRQPAQTRQENTAQSSQTTFPGGGGGPFSGGGPASPFRLFKADLGGQVSWLLPFALFGLLALAWQTRIRLPLSRSHQHLILWGTWILVTGIFFSVASFFHEYYLVVVAPAIAAATGIGLVILWHEYQQRSTSNWRTWILPLAFLCCAAEQVYLLVSYPSWSTFLTPLILILSLLAALALVLAKLQPRLSSRPLLLQQPAVIVALLTLLITPLIWSIVSDQTASNPTIPTAGPTLSTNDFARLFNTNQSGNDATNPFGAIPGGLPGNLSGDPSSTGSARGALSESQQVDNKLLTYLEQHQGSTSYLVAMSSAISAAPYIIQTGKPIMALGGFTGSDPILNQQKVSALVKNNTIRYFLLPSNQLPSTLSPEIREQLEKILGGNGGGGFGGFGGNNEVTRWVQNNCKAVPTSAYNTTNPNSGQTSPNQLPGNLPGSVQGTPPANFPGGFPGGAQGTPPANFPGGFPGGAQGTPPANFPGGFPGGAQGTPPANFPGVQGTPPNNSDTTPASGSNLPGAGRGFGGMNNQLYDCSSTN